tara:strand:+ start:1085 stop:1354 length:270 start_codon:yes stop_codon:yes gene_type:complete
MGVHHSTLIFFREHHATIITQMIDTTTMPTYHVSLVIQADASPADWLLSVIKESLEEDEYVALKDIHEIKERDLTLEHHGGYQDIPTRY